MAYETLTKQCVGERIVTTIGVKKIGELGTTLAVTINGRTLRKRQIPEDGILHSHRREKLKFHKALSGWALQRRRIVFPVKYELRCFAEDSILHNHCLEHLKSYKALTGWAL
jgi:hypothetical protein